MSLSCFVTSCKVKLKTKEPSHRAFTFYGVFFLFSYKNITEDSYNTEKNSNFVVGGYIMKVTL